MHREPRLGVLFWLMNNLTYIQKYVLAGTIRGVGFLILWLFLYFLISRQADFIDTQIKVGEGQSRYIKEMQADPSGLREIASEDMIKTGYLSLENVHQRLRESLDIVMDTLVLLNDMTKKGGIAPQDKSEILFATTFLKHNLNKILMALDQSKFKAEGSITYLDLGKRLNIAAYQYQMSVEDFIYFLNENYFKRADNKLLEGQLSYNISDVMSSTFVLWDIITKELYLILDQEKAAIRSGLIYIFSIASLFVFAGCWLGVHFVYEAIKCFKALDTGTRRLTSGDLKARVAVQYEDEIGKASVAFNAMAAHLDLLITQQRNLMEATSRLAEGDFSARVKMEGSMDQEMIQVSTSFNWMAQSFEEILAELHRLGINLTSSAMEIAGASTKQEDLILKQNEATFEISTTASQISRTAKDFAKTINEVGKVAEETSALAGAGRGSLTNMEKVMRQMVRASGTIAEKLSLLNEKASQITSVVTTITKVADQTNLLSLNAAIEAEKTGEFGRRFSVIAREIRRLADQTALATLDIKKIIGEMMMAVASSVAGVDTFRSKIRYGVEQVTKVGDELGKIILQVQALALRFEEVNSGMQNQSLSAEKINEAMVHLTQLANATTDSIQQFRHTIEHLSSDAEDLHRAIIQRKS